MAQYEELPVYKATYDLLVEIFRFTKNFKRNINIRLERSLKMNLAERSHEQSE
jgi:hypothetical protein